MATDLAPGAAAASPMDRAWRPQDVEQEMYQAWEDAGLFMADPADPRPHYSIVLPPPNVTGELHLGHALNGALQDLYARYKRMRGFEVLWLPGTDHAAIGTQVVIERQLAAEGTTKEQLGRPAFEKRVAEWYATYRARITDQYKRLGASMDWSRQRFTMDDAYVTSVRAAFVKLYDAGLIYRGPRIVNWCPRCRSSVSDLEVDWREHEDTLYYIRYDMADSDGALVIATVRPETMLADTAVAVNPKDARYAKFIGRVARLPLVGRELPVVGDDAVEMDFGTGALKVTPGHDPMDYEIGRRHGLEIITCIDKDGNIVSDTWVPDELRTRDALTARDRVVEMLRERDHLVRTEAYVHEVGHCDRCGEIIQPMVDDQWWCAMEGLAKPAIDVVESGKVTFVPEKWNKTYLDWMRGLRDWNVSRQLWLGHRIPIYYCFGDATPPADVAELRNRAVHTFASVDEPSACPQCGGTHFAQDPDVLDTWFSSALWPYATMGWPESTADLDGFFPTDILVTAREIINLWVARMIMTSLQFLGEIPFHHVLITAVVQDTEGRRMSKSKGNGVDPLEMVDRYGADAVRAWACEIGVPRQDVRFDEVRIEDYRNFANKLWNVARLTLMNAEGVALDPDPAPGDDPFDRWILSRLDGLIETVTDAIEGYRPVDAIRAIYDFTWKELADWYLEVAKARFRLAPSEPGRKQAVSVAVRCVETVVLLLHPFMPYISEAVGERLPAYDGYLIRRGGDRWPVARGWSDPGQDAAAAGLFDLVRELRDARRELGARPGERLTASATVAAGGPTAELALSPTGRSAVASLAGVDIEEIAAAPGARTLVLGGIQLQLNPPQRSDLPSDDAGVARAVSEARASIDKLEALLARPGFVEKARAEVVTKARDDLRSAQDRLRRLEAAQA